MVTTMFLSMWITNTATTAMMVPIVEAVISELHKEFLQRQELRRRRFSHVPNIGGSKNFIFKSLLLLQNKPRMGFI